MEMFGISSVEELNGAKIHRLENILTLAIHVHDSFDSLDFYLEKREGVRMSTCLSFAHATDMASTRTSETGTPS